MAMIAELDAANLFAGDDDPNKSEYLAMTEVKLPMLQEKTREHLGGGMMGAINVSVRVFEAMEMTFKLRGFNPDVMKKFGLNSPSRQRYTVLGNVRELVRNTEMPVKAVVQGRLIRMENDAFTRDGGISHDYQIAEVDFYALYLDNQEKFYVNLWEGPSGLRVDGVVQYGNMARNLGLA